MFDSTTGTITLAVKGWTKDGRPCSVPTPVAWGAEGITDITPAADGLTCVFNDPGEGSITVHAVANQGQPSELSASDTVVFKLELDHITIEKA